METCLAGDDDWRGGDGPIVLERGPASSPLFAAFFEAAQQAGYELTDDVNGYRQEGFAPFDRTIHRGRRVSAARAYLHPAMPRPNLEVRCRTFVDRVVFEGTRATGVELDGGEVVRAGEVILCGGAINTPQLLQLSGVGNAGELEPLGVRRRPRPAGASARTSRTISRSTSSTRRPSRCRVQPALKKWRRPEIGARWLFLRSGPGATNHFEAGGFVRSNDDVAYPNLMFHFLPLAIRYDGSAPAGGHGYQVHVGPMYSDVRGSLKIVIADPRVHPGLRFNYLSTRTTGASGSRRSASPARSSDSRLSRRTTAARLARAGRADRRGDPRLGRARRRDRAPSVVHVRDGNRRVDPATMRVHGSTGIRVVDASVFPSVPNGNIYAPVMMVAEKAADLIRGDTPLAAHPPRLLPPC